MSKSFAIVFVLFLSLLFFGCITPTNNTVNNTTVTNTTATNNTMAAEEFTIVQGRAVRFGDLAIGVVNVQAGSATVSIWNGSAEQTFELAVGDEVAFGGYTIKNFGVDVNPLPSLAPGNGNGDVTLLINSTQSNTIGQIQNATATSPSCGDGICQSNENCSSCSKDCGLCNSSCYLLNNESQNYSISDCKTDSDCELGPEYGICGWSGSCGVNENYSSAYNNSVQEEYSKEYAKYGAVPCVSPECGGPFECYPKCVMGKCVVIRIEQQ